LSPKHPREHAGNEVSRTSPIIYYGIKRQRTENRPFPRSRDFCGGYNTGAYSNVYGAVVRDTRRTDERTVRILQRQTFAGLWLGVDSVIVYSVYDNNNNIILMWS
jgi:hypothetical protein